MKFRRDFVTNSSSSSYVCEICGRTESGWDMGLSECEMMQCVNGHTFCCDESLDVNQKELIQIILENEYHKKCNNYKDDYSEEELIELNNDELMELVTDGGYYDVPECVCPICQFIEYSEYDLSKYLEREYKISRDTVFAQVKELNKRRKKLYENEYITYVCKEFNLNPTEIVAEWKAKFGTYSEFRKFLNNK
jgi:AraC-like DNA-binding protein